METGKKKVTPQEADAVSRPTPTYADPTFGYGHDGFPALSMLLKTRLGGSCVPPRRSLATP